MPKTNITVNARCIGGTMTVVSGQNYTWYIDEPADLGGADCAPSPVQMLMGSIAGCITATGQRVAREMDLALGNIGMRVSGTIYPDRFLGEEAAQALRSGFTDIRVEITGAPAWTKEQRARWLAEVYRRCPVIDNVAAPTCLKLAWKEP